VQEEDVFRLFEIAVFLNIKRTCRWEFKYYFVLQQGLCKVSSLLTFYQQDVETNNYFKKKFGTQPLKSLLIFGTFYNYNYGLEHDYTPEHKSQSTQ